jgi:DNA methylase
VADAIKDCSRRGAIVLDPFGGSGTTLIAAQKSGRLARLIEYDPAYCDVVIQRFETVTGASAILASTRQTFEDVATASAQPNRLRDDDDDGESVKAKPLGAHGQ